MVKTCVEELLLYASVNLIIIFPMPLTIHQSQLPALCLLSNWVVRDESKFIQAIAWLYLQKDTHADRIARALLPLSSTGLPGNPFFGALKKLKYKHDDLKADLLSSDVKVKKKAQKVLDTRISHRDGLLFQHISWLAAAMEYPGSLKAAPHPRQADKGFDGIVLEIDRTAFEISRLIVCEDKASSDPRKLITTGVWGDFKLILSGERDDELNPEVQGLLKTLQGVSENDLEKILEAVSWKKRRHFRVAVAAGKNREKNGAYGHLFEGFDTTVPDSAENARFAAVMPMSDVRNILNEIADKVYLKVQEMEKTYARTEGDR